MKKISVSARLRPGEKAEIAFVVWKFYALNKAVQKNVLSQLSSAHSSGRTTAANTLGGLLVSGRPGNLVAFVNEYLGANFSGYLVWPQDLEGKSKLIALYFMEHLQNGRRKIPAPIL